LPGFATWPTFPFDGDLRVKKLDDPVAVEPPRHGDDPSECRACQAPDEAYIWVSERWRVRSLDRPTGLPMVLILESRSHLDLGDLPNMLAAELGVMTVRLERAVRSLDGVARVHVNRWGDGSAHLHLWFLARPYGRLQLRGTFLSLWDEILPPIGEHQWRENLALVAAWLAEFGGRPLAEPPRIDWKSPATLTPSQDDDAGVGDADDGAAGVDDEAADPEATRIIEPRPSSDPVRSDGEDTRVIDPSAYEETTRAIDVGAVAGLETKELGAPRPASVPAEGDGERARPGGADRDREGGNRAGEAASGVPAPTQRAMVGIEKDADAGTRA
jgi:hypothetical protein